MEPRVLGWPADGPTIRLDHRRFAYAGKFVMSSTGKAVLAPEGWERAGGRDESAATGSDTGDVSASDAGAASEGGTGATPGGDPGAATGGDSRSDAPTESAVLAAAAFDEDRTDPAVLRIRYVTVRDDRRGEGLGVRLCAFVCDRAAVRNYEFVRIAVNNPYAYEALHRAGFAFTGEETGLAELVLERPAGESAPVDPDRYRAGLDSFAGREGLSDEERAFLREKRNRGPPERTVDE